MRGVWALPLCAIPLQSSKRFHQREEEEGERSPVAVAGPSLDVDAPLWNLELQTPAGRACVRRTQYPLDHQHGDYTLRARARSPAQRIAAVVSRRRDQPARRAVPRHGDDWPGRRQGTLVFLIGVGYFDGEAFTVDQFFLRDPNEEPAMLHALQERSGPARCSGNL